MTQPTSTTAVIDAEQIERALTAAVPFLERSLDTALRVVGVLIANEAKINHDYTDRTGRLTQSIRASEPTGELFNNSLGIDVVAGGLGLVYASHVEFGTKPHQIKIKKKRVLSDKRTIFGTVVNHPGNREFRFMRNALDSQVGEAAQLIERAVDHALDEAGL